MHLFDSIASLFVRHTFRKNTTERPIQLDPLEGCMLVQQICLLTATIQSQGHLCVVEAIEHSQNLMYSVFSAYCIVCISHDHICGGPVWLILTQKALWEVKLNSMFLYRPTRIYLSSKMCWQWREMGWSDELWLIKTLNAMFKTTSPYLKDRWLNFLYFQSRFCRDRVQMNKVATCTFREMCGGGIT